MDAFGLKDGNVDMERERVRTAVRLLQNHPKFFGVPVVSMPENAPGCVPPFNSISIAHVVWRNAGPHLADHLYKVPGVLTMAEWSKSGSHYGVPATDRRDQTLFMSKLLAGHAIYYSENCMTCVFLLSRCRDVSRRRASYPGASLERNKDKFEQQLLSWERLVKEDPSDPFAAVKFKYTAKHVCGNDDLAVCGIMFDWVERFNRSDKPDYVAFRRAHILPRIEGRR